MQREMREGERPERFRHRKSSCSTRPRVGKSLVIVFLETEDDSRRGREVPDAMPGGDTHVGNEVSRRDSYEVWYREEVLRSFGGGAAICPSAS
jgi:hypothetical protein